MARMRMKHWARAWPVELHIPTDKHKCTRQTNCNVMQALLEGRDEDEADEVKLPPIPLKDIERLAKAAGRSTIRESTCTHIRRVSCNLFVRGNTCMPMLMSV